MRFAVPVETSEEIGRAMRLSVWIPLLLAAMTACTSGPPTPFGLRVERWTGDAVDTFAGTVTKDMVPDPDTTIALTLTPEELESIRQEVIETRFFELPDTILGSSLNVSGILTRIELRMGRRSKTVTVRTSTDWDQALERWRIRGRLPQNESTREQRLRVDALSRHVFALVKAHPEYRALPRPRGGYL
jgi:hypothetical protein